MPLERQYEQFADGLSPYASINSNYIPLEYRRAQGSRRPGDIFRANWDLADTLHGEAAGFNKILQDALAQGSERAQKTHEIMVHVDWLASFADNPVVRAFFADLEKITDGSNAIFLTYKPFATDIRDTRFAESVDFHHSRAIPTTVGVHKRGGGNFGTGFLDLQELEDFFSLTEGYHPDDRFRLHGGLWQACLTMTALMITGLSIGKRWVFADYGEPLKPVMDSQRVVLDQAADLSKGPVQFGLVYDASQISRDPDRLEPEQRVTQKFHDSSTQIVSYQE